MLCLASVLSKGYSFGELSKFGVYICLVSGDDECESFMSVRIGDWEAHLKEGRSGKTDVGG